MSLIRFKGLEQQQLSDEEEKDQMENFDDSEDDEYDMDETKSNENDNVTNTEIS